MGGADRPLSGVTLAPRRRRPAAARASRRAATTLRTGVRVGSPGWLVRQTRRPRPSPTIPSARDVAGARRGASRSRARADRRVARAGDTGCAALDALGPDALGQPREAVGRVVVARGKRNAPRAAAARANVDGAGVLYVDADRLRTIPAAAPRARRRDFGARPAGGEPEELAAPWRCTSRRQGRVRGASAIAAASGSSGRRHHPRPRHRARARALWEGPFAERASALAEQATLFKRLAEAHGVAELVTGRGDSSSAAIARRRARSRVHGKDDRPRGTSPRQHRRRTASTRASSCVRADRRPGTEPDAGVRVAKLPTSTRRVRIPAPP